MIADRYVALEAVRPGQPQRARDRQTAQTVWLREATIAPNDRDAALARARSATGLLHPSLVALFDVVELSADRVLLAYEFVPAQSIRDLAGGQPLNPRRAAELMGEVADGVAALHARGLVHGAINCETVLVTHKGKAKLDRLADPRLTSGETLGVAGDLRGIVAVLREVTNGSLAIVNEIIALYQSGTSGSAVTLAASLRFATRR
jgi:serine/threonine protein kinase